MESKKGYFIDIEKGTVESAEEHDEKVKLKERQRILDAINLFIGSDYNTREMKLFKSDLLEWLGGAEE